MKWFKLIWLNSEERAALKRGMSMEEPKPVTEDPSHVTRPVPYRNIIYSNKNLTVILNDGSVLSKSNMQSSDFQDVKNASTEAEIVELMREVNVPSSLPDCYEDKRLVLDNLSVIRNNPDFVVKGNNVYLKNVNLEMPISIIASFIELLEKRQALTSQIGGTLLYHDVEEQIRALKMFWLKLALNSLPQSREDLLAFVRKNDVKITRNGNLVLYRRIVSTGDSGNNALVRFVSSEYYRIKRSKKDPREYAVVGNPDGYKIFHVSEVKYIIREPIHGNLQVLYLNLPDFEDNQFTSSHNRGKIMIKIGGIYKIPDDEINLDNGLCAAGGLHAAAVDYNYSAFGDTPVVVLVNPSKAITVPTGDIGKLRTTEMFIACVNDKPQGVHFDENALFAFDEEYHDLTLNELEEVVRTKSFEKLSVQNEVPAISLVDVSAIRNLLINRVKQIQ